MSISVNSFVTGFDSQRSQNIFRGKIVDVAEVNHRRFLEESGQRLENVDPTHRELTSANNKKVLQKKEFSLG